MTRAMPPSISARGLQRGREMKTGRWPEPGVHTGPQAGRTSRIHEMPRRTPSGAPLPGSLPESGTLSNPTHQIQASGTRIDGQGFSSHVALRICEAGALAPFCFVPPRAGARGAPDARGHRLVSPCGRPSTTPVRRVCGIFEVERNQGPAETATPYADRTAVPRARPRPSQTRALERASEDGGPCVGTRMAPAHTHWPRDRTEPTRADRVSPPWARPTEYCRHLRGSPGAMYRAPLPRLTRTLFTRGGQCNAVITAPAPSEGTRDAPLFLAARSARRVPAPLPVRDPRCKAGGGASGGPRRRWVCRPFCTSICIAHFYLEAPKLLRVTQAQFGAEVFHS